MYQLKIICLFLLTICVIEITQAQSNYCNANLCKGERHIGCNNKGSFAKVCSRNAKVIRITPKLQQRIVKKHNSIRNRIANGKVKGFKPAVRMATIRWSPELAKLAVYNVKQCKMKHDKCHNTRKFSYTGQNLAQHKWSGQNKSIAAIVTNQIHSWFRENNRCSMKDINKLEDISKCGHFTAMVNEKNIAVGCAILRQRKGRQTTQLMACNYAYSNVFNKPVYRDGKTASKCKNGRNRNFSGLCHHSENYNLKSSNM